MRNLCPLCKRALPKKRIRAVSKKPIRQYEHGIRVYPDGRERCMTKDAWNKRRAELYEAKSGHCESCGCWTFFSAFHAHHKIKRSVGRDDRFSNLQGLCETCHAKVHDEFRKVQR